MVRRGLVSQIKSKASNNIGTVSIFSSAPFLPITSANLLSLDLWANPNPYKLHIVFTRYARRLLERDPPHSMLFLERRKSKVSITTVSYINFPTSPSIK